MKDVVNVKTMWLRKPNARPVACIAYSVDGSTVRFATATYNKKDPWSPDKARYIATGRLTKSKTEVYTIQGYRLGVDKPELLILDALRVSPVHVEKVQKQAGRLFTAMDADYKQYKQRLAEKASRATVTP